VAFDRAGARVFVAAAKTGVLQVFDVKSGTHVKNVPIGTRCWHFSFTPDDKNILTQQRHHQNPTEIPPPPTTNLDSLKAWSGPCRTASFSPWRVNAWCALPSPFASPTPIRPLPAALAHPMPVVLALSATADGAARRDGGPLPSPSLRACLVVAT
jgi:DNA-binding beta-propeller fold protein YncE